MKKIVAAGCMAALLTGVAGWTAQDGPEMPKPQKEHEWLQQIVGEWESEMECMMGPDKPPLKCKGTESGRMIGGFWAMLETKSEVMATPFTGILTLGYDSEKKKYVGTWIDSMTGHMWKYDGSVDASGKILTLDTEGPSHDQPGKSAKYKEVMEIKSKDHKVFTSSIEKDGKWVTFMTAHARRKK